MSDTTGFTGADALKALQAATHGLLFPSESDKPITAILWNVSAAGSGLTQPVDAATLQAYVTVSPGSNVEALTVTDLLAPVTADQAWFGSEEKATTQRFRDLEKILNQLTGVRAFRVTSADPRAAISIYMVGYTSEGYVAGVSTELVET